MWPCFLGVGLGRAKEGFGLNGKTCNHSAGGKNRCSGGRIDCLSVDLFLSEGEVRKGCKRTEPGADKHIHGRMGRVFSIYITKKKRVTPQCLLR